MPGKASSLAQDATEGVKARVGLLAERSLPGGKPRGGNGRPQGTGGLPWGHPALPLRCPRTGDSGLGQGTGCRQQQRGRVEPHAGRRGRPQGDARSAGQGAGTTGGGQTQRNQAQKIQHN